jgi:hypothetical protein
MSKIICHQHCPRGGFPAGLAVLVVIAALCAAAARSAAPAIESAARAAIEVIKIAAISAASLCGVAGLGWLVHARQQAHGGRATARQDVSRHAPIAQRAPEALSAPPRAAIEAPRPALADLKAMAAEHGYDVIRQATGE